MPFPASAGPALECRYPHRHTDIYIIFLNTIDQAAWEPEEVLIVPSGGIGDRMKKQGRTAQMVSQCRLCLVGTWSVQLASYN